MSNAGLQVYRKLLRSVGKTFKGDAAMLSAARLEVRTNFENSRQVTDPVQQQELLAQGEEAAEFIRMQIVQAAVNERGNYEMPVMPEHTGAVMEPARDAKLPRDRKKKPTAQ